MKRPPDAPASAVVRRPAEVPSTVVARARERAAGYAASSKAPNTLRAYAADWQDFVAWCDGAARPALPSDPETVALYISDLAAHAKVSTIRRRLTSISKAHELDGHASPCKHTLVGDVFDGIRRELGHLQKGKTPLILDDVRAMIDAQPDTLAGVRNRALLLVGFAGCFRRSELVGLDVRDLAFTRDGLVVHLRRSKTDPFGEGIKKAIPYGQHEATCPVRALEAWLAALGVGAGPVFRAVHRTGRIADTRLTDRSVALLVKQAALGAGLDPTRYAGHSLRAGFATQAAISGVPERAIIKQGAWASERMARRYIRDGSLFRDNAAGQIGL